MENCLNTKRYLRHKLCIWGLCLFLPAMLHQKRAAAQPFFNRLYTNNASGSVFMSVCPQGKEGGFMAVAYANDSGTNKIGLRVSRLNSAGILQQSNFFTLTDYPARTLYVHKNSLAKVNDNQFIIAGEIYPVGFEQYAFIASVDSNGTLIKYQDIKNPFPGPVDSFMRTVNVKFDGKNIVMLSHIYMGYPNTMQLLTKFDTALNIVWEKTYSEGLFPRKLVYSLHADDSGYVLAGVSDKDVYTSKNFKSSAFVFRTDTAGMVQWRWNSPTMMSAAAHIVRTLDGAYVFAAMGNVYDRDSAHPTWSAYWHAQEIMVKISSEGNFLWQKLYSPKYFPNLGINNSRLLPTNDSGFLSVHIYTDSPGTIDKTAFADLHRYSADGDLMFKHKFQVPTDTPMKGYTAINDIRRCADNGILMAGYFDNRLSTATAPEQRGWLLKTDSNGCMGADDPQCDPAGIITPFVAKNDFLIYPNPAGAEFFVENKKLENKTLELYIYDLYSRLLLIQILSKGLNTVQLNHTPQGLYFYQIKENRQVLESGKLLKL